MFRKALIFFAVCSPCYGQNLQKDIDDALKEMDRKIEKVDNRVDKKVDKEDGTGILLTGTGTASYQPDEGRLVVFVQSKGFKTPDAYQGTTTNLGVLVKKLNNIGIYNHNLKILQNDVKENYETVEIYGGVVKKSVFKTKDGYIAQTHLQVTVKTLANLDKAMDFAANHGTIQYRGFGSSKETEFVHESRIKALENLGNQIKSYQKLLNIKLRLTSFKEEFVGDRNTPNIDANIMIVCKIKADFEIEKE